MLSLNDPMILREIIMDHYQNPRNRGLVDDDSYKKVNMNSETCIDNLDIQVKLDGDMIEVNNQLYYVYASDNVYIYCLNLYKYNPKDIKKYEIISINSKMYYVSFKEMTSFKRTTKMNIVDIAYKSEKEVILEKKFLSKKALKKQKK